MVARGWGGDRLPPRWVPGEQDAGDREGNKCRTPPSPTPLALSPTETMFEIGKTLKRGKWRNTGVASDGKTANNWLIVPRCGCESRDEDHDWPS